MVLKYQFQVIYMLDRRQQAVVAEQFQLVGEKVVSRCNWKDNCMINKVPEEAVVDGFNMSKSKDSVDISSSALTDRRRSKEWKRETCV